MLWSREAGTSLFVCTHRTHLAWTVCTLMRTKWILIHFYIAARSVCKSSTHNATSKNEFSLSLFHDARIQNSRISRNIFRGQNVVPVAVIFRKNGHDTQGKLSLQHAHSSGVRADLKGAMPRFAHLEKFSLHFSSSSFVIQVNLLHP